jgi:hypothetical protein
MQLEFTVVETLWQAMLFHLACKGFLFQIHTDCTGLRVDLYALSYPQYCEQCVSIWCAALSFGNQSILIVMYRYFIIVFDQMLITGRMLDETVVANCLRPGPYVGRLVKKIGEIARHRTPQISPIWLNVRTAVKFTCEIILEIST